MYATNDDICQTVTVAQPTPTTGPIRFMKHYVTDGVHKAKVWYSHYRRTTDQRLCVVLYAKEYMNDLHKIFASGYTNDTDTMTDYFDKGQVTLLDDHPLYAQALVRFNANKKD